MNSFPEQAEALAARLHAESAAGVWDESINAELKALREAWKALDPPERDTVAPESAKIAALVKTRPASPPMEAAPREAAPLPTPLDEEAEAVSYTHLTLPTNREV